MQLEFLDRCVNEDERLPLVQSRQLQYWERLLSSSKDESNASLIDREASLCLSKVIHSRSEEHTSELQSLMRISYAVFCLKNNTKKTHQRTHKKHKIKIQ